MFPCEMARYIAGFSREARKSGRFAACRPTSAGPSAHESGGEKANLFGLASAGGELGHSAQYAPLLRPYCAAPPGDPFARATNGREGAVRQAPREDSPSVQRWIGWCPFGRVTRSEIGRPVRSDPGLRSERFGFQHLGTFGGHFLAAAGAAGRGGGGGGAGRGGGGAGRAIWGAGRGGGGGGGAGRGGGAAIRGGGGAGLAICGPGRGGGGGGAARRGGSAR